MEFKIPVKKENIYDGILMVLNFYLKLSNEEIKMLSILLQHNVTIVNTDARALLRSVMNKDKYATNNYIKRLMDKNIILKNKDTKVLYIDPRIINITNEKEFNFKFINND